MLPWKSIIQIRKNSDTPIYLQIANALIGEMIKGRVGPGIKLPGTRQMSEILNLHRKTLVRAYEELDAQGWITMLPSKGTFTSQALPEIRPKILITNKEKSSAFSKQTGYPVPINESIRNPVLPNRNIIGFHDGPDVRLMPIKELGRAYRSILSRTANLKYMSYVEIAGVQKFRAILSEELNSSRGLQTNFENIMITRGCQMGLYLLSSVLFSKGDSIIVGDTNYYYADHVFMDAGVNIVRVRVDEYG